MQVVGRELYQEVYVAVNDRDLRANHDRVGAAATPTPATPGFVFGHWEGRCVKLINPETTVTGVSRYLLTGMICKYPELESRRQGPLLSVAV